MVWTILALIIALPVGLILLVALIQTATNWYDLIVHKKLVLVDEDAETVYVLGKDNKKIIRHIVPHFFLTVGVAGIFMYLLKGILW